MKKVYLFILLAFLISQCGDDEPLNIEVYNTEAFAYNISDGIWEVNATTRVKGFKQNENNGQFTASLSYDIDLITPSGETISSMISRTADKENSERMSDTELEVQFELDSTYSAGTYQLIFRVRDALTESADTSKTEFRLD